MKIIKLMVILKMGAIKLIKMKTIYHCSAKKIVTIFNYFTLCDSHVETYTLIHRFYYWMGYIFPDANTNHVNWLK